MKYLLIFIMLFGLLFSQKTPVNFFKQYDIPIFHDTTANVITITNISNIMKSDNILSEIAYTINIYNRYLSIFNQNMNGLVIWFDDISYVDFNSGFLEFYNSSSSSTKMQLIYTEMINKLPLKHTVTIRKSRHYQLQHR